MPISSLTGDGLIPYVWPKTRELNWWSLFSKVRWPKVGLQSEHSRVELCNVSNSTCLLNEPKIRARGRILNGSSPVYLNNSLNEYPLMSRAYITEFSSSRRAKLNCVELGSFITQV